MLTRRSQNKVIQAVGVLLSKEQTRRMDRARLLKLLYIAERESLKERGVPILGGRVVAMKKGPLHSEVYDLIKGEQVDVSQWMEFFQNVGYQIELVHVPSRDELSEYEINKLNEISDRYASKDAEEVVEETHSFVEYIKNYIENTSKTIPLDDILEAVGRGSDKELIKAEIAAFEEYEKLFQQFS